jgi:hypothetical protein
MDLAGDGSPELVAMSDDMYWYASRVVVLQFRDKQFHEISEYWNPGLLYQFRHADIDHDGVQEVACVGVNNDLQYFLPYDGNLSAIFLLDGLDISGQAPPWLGDNPEGHERWYLVVVPSSVNIAEIDFDDFNSDGLAEVHITLSDACSYYVSPQGKIVGAGIGSSCDPQGELRRVRSQ